MTNSPSEPTRIDRLEALAETILLAIQQQSQQQQTLFEQQNRDREEFRASIQDVVQMVGTVSNDVNAIMSQLVEMQSEVRGLQTENRRILDRLERHVGDGHGTQL